MNAPTVLTFVVLMFVFVVPAVITVAHGGVSWVVYGRARPAAAALPMCPYCGERQPCAPCVSTIAKLTAPGPKMATEALKRVHEYGARPEDFGWRYNEVTFRWYHNDGRVVTAEQLHAAWR